MIATLLALAAAAAAPAPFRCGAVQRPGIAEQGDDGVWRGIAIDLCRQAARSEQSSSAIAFRPYRRIADLRDARHDALAVLSRAELAIARPAPGGSAPPALSASARPVATSRQVLLVRPGTALHRPADLAGRRVCFIIATAAEAALNTWIHAARVPVQRVGFQEPVELRDAFDAGYCPAMAVDARDIPGGAGHTKVLGPPLAKVALFAVPAFDTAR